MDKATAQQSLRQGSEDHSAQEATASTKSLAGARRKQKMAAKQMTFSKNDSVRTSSQHQLNPLRGSLKASDL